MLQWLSRHLDVVLDGGRADFGPCPTAMWLASLDTRTGHYPSDDTRPAHIGRRHYRAIDAPRGCSLYWDQPLLAAAHGLSAVAREPRYAQAADDYVRDFLRHCVAPNGMFLWGNHYYWDAFDGHVRWFQGEEQPQPLDVACTDGALHEARPIPPAWAVMWRIDPQRTERAIRQFVDQSLFDSASGGFNRHADQRRGCAFIESGGIMVESLAWLDKQIHEPTLLDLADRIAAFTFAHRNGQTGLIENNPTVQRWDKFACTTEVGLWAGSLLRAADHVDSAERAQRWRQMADAAMSAYLRYGYDPQANGYYGALNVADGSPLLGALDTGSTARHAEHRPGDHADLWRPLFPAHDYPMPFAETCLRLWEITGELHHRLACERWCSIIGRSLPARGGQGAYAEHYGRVIHFLWRCGKVLSMPAAAALAQRVADEAIAVLWDGSMFRSHPGEHRYDAVDGVGYLALALLALSADADPDLFASGW
jgi:hypothetical protein